jgi:translocation protein SEC66
MASIIIPIAYLIVIFGGLYVFSVLYRRHLAGKSTHIIFTHRERAFDLTFSSPSLI